MTTTTQPTPTPPQAAPAQPAQPTAGDLLSILNALYRLAHAQLVTGQTSQMTILWRELGDVLADVIGERRFSRPAAPSAKTLTSRLARPISMPPARRGAVQAPFPVPSAVSPRREGPQGHGPSGLSRTAAPVSVVVAKPPSRVAVPTQQQSQSAKNTAAANAILADQAAKAKRVAQPAQPVPATSRDIRVRDDVAAELIKIAQKTGKPG